MNMLLLSIGVCAIAVLAVIGFLEKTERMHRYHQQLGNLWLVFGENRVPLYRLGMSLGRRKRRCDINTENDLSISRSHARITNKNGSFYIFPEKKANGYTDIYVNGKKVSAAGAAIDKNCNIRMGNTFFHVEEQKMALCDSLDNRQLPAAFYKHSAIIKVIGLLLCAAFMVLLFMKASSIIPSDNAASLTTALIINFSLLFCSWLYSYLCKAHIQAFSSAICLLLSISCSYQGFFPAFGPYLLKLYLGIAIGILTYFFWKRVQKLKDWQFTAICFLLVLLLFLNLCFGETINGAKLWLFGIQPGEAIKTMLLVLLGAYCSTKKQKFLYCGCCAISCIILLLLRDFGTVVIIFFVFLLNSYLIFDSRKTSLALIAGSIAAFGLLVSCFPHAIDRVEQCWKAFEIPGGQQKKAILAALLGGWNGLDSNFEIFTRIFAADNDLAMLGTSAVLGWIPLMVIICLYAFLAFITGFNYSITDSAYRVHSQLGGLSFCHVTLNYLGSLDLVPFTGTISPFLSTGGTSALCFGVLFGIAAGVMTPKLKRKTGD